MRPLTHQHTQAHVNTCRRELSIQCWCLPSGTAFLLRILLHSDSAPQRPDLIISSLSFKQFIIYTNPLTITGRQDSPVTAVWKALLNRWKINTSHIIFYQNSSNVTHFILCMSICQFKPITNGCLHAFSNFIFQDVLHSFNLPRPSTFIWFRRTHCKLFKSLIHHVISNTWASSVRFPLLRLKRVLYMWWNNK